MCGTFEALSALSEFNPMEPRRVFAREMARRSLERAPAVWQGRREQEDAMAHSFDRGCLHSSTATPTEMP